MPIGRARGFGTNSSRDLPYARGASSRGDGIDGGAGSGVGVGGVFDLGAGLLANRRYEVPNALHWQPIQAAASMPKLAERNDVRETIMVLLTSLGACKMETRLSKIWLTSAFQMGRAMLVGFPQSSPLRG